MQLEEYFDFDNPNGIRIRGTRVNLDDVVYAARDGKTPGRIVQSFPTLNLEQVHAALAYYYRNRQAVDDYLRKQEAAFEEAKRRNESVEPPEVVKRLLAARAEERAST